MENPDIVGLFLYCLLLSFVAIGGPPTVLVGRWDAQHPHATPRSAAPCAIT